MGVVKYNFKDFDDCINKTQTSKRYIDQAENIVEAVYGPLDWRIASQNGKTYSKIVDKMTDMEEDISKVINYCKSILSEYEKMEAKINKELSNLQSKSLKISKLLSTSLFDVGTAIYEKAKIEAKENPKKETPPKEETKKKKKKQNFLQRSWNSATKKVKSIGDSVADTACDFGEWMIYEPVGEKWKDIKHIGNGIGKDLKSAGETAVEVRRRGVLTGCNACSGFTWGLADFTEGLYDGLTYIGTGLLTPVTGLVDGGQAIGCLISGNKYDSITVNMWQGASESVKTDIAGYQKEKYYKKNGYGDLLKEDSYAYEAVNKTSETVGYISGAIMTGGAGIQIGTASMAISGIGNGSEDALKSGATIGESIISGAVQGIIDGASYLFGAKLGQKVFGQGSTKFDKVWTKIFGDTATVKSNVANVAIKSGADMADGAINTLAQPAIQKIYRDESYGELFQQNGGYSTLFTNVAIAGGLSAASEGLEIKSKSKNMEIPTEQSIPKSTAPIKDIETQIESANDYAKRGMISSINLNSLDDIDIFDIMKINNKQLVVFKLADGTTYDYTEVINYKVKQTNVNKKVALESNESDVNSVKIKHKQIDSEYKKFESYDEFVEYYKKKTSEWWNNLTESEQKLLKAYTREDQFAVGNYMPVNGLLRGNLINYDTKTITIKGTYKTKEVLSFDEFEAKYDITIEQFIDTQEKAATDLRNAISKMTLDENTIIYRGINIDALSEYGITEFDDIETIKKKILKQGNTYCDKGFMSSSPAPEKKGITGDKVVQLVMNCKKGTSAADLSYINASEREVLINAGTLFNIDDVKKENGKIYIYLTTIDK